MEEDDVAALVVDNGSGRQIKMNPINILINWLVVTCSAFKAMMHVFIYS